MRLEPIAGSNVATPMGESSIGELIVVYERRVSDVAFAKQKLNAAKRAFDAGNRRHLLVVDAVLKADEHTVLGVDMVEHRRRRPLRVVGLDGDKDGVERLGFKLQFVDVDGFGVGQVLASPGLDNKTVGPDLLDMLLPPVDKRDVVPALGQQTANNTADPASPHNPNSHRSWSPLISKTNTPPNLFGGEVYALVRKVGRGRASNNRRVRGPDATFPLTQTLSLMERASGCCQAPLEVQPIAR